MLSRFTLSGFTLSQLGSRCPDHDDDLTLVLAVNLLRDLFIGSLSSDWRMAARIYMNI